MRPARGASGASVAWVVSGLAQAHLHLLEGHLRDLGNEVVQTVARLERDVMPRRDSLAVLQQRQRADRCDGMWSCW